MQSWNLLIQKLRGSFRWDSIYACMWNYKESFLAHNVIKAPFFGNIHYVVMNIYICAPNDATGRRELGVWRLGGDFNEIKKINWGQSGVFENGLRHE